MNNQFISVSAHRAIALVHQCNYSEGRGQFAPWSCAIFRCEMFSVLALQNCLLNNIAFLSPFTFPVIQWCASHCLDGRLTLLVNFSFTQFSYYVKLNNNELIIKSNVEIGLFSHLSYNGTSFSVGSRLYSIHFKSSKPLNYFMIAIKFTGPSFEKKSIHLRELILSVLKRQNVSNNNCATFYK